MIPNNGFQKDRGTMSNKNINNKNLTTLEAKGPLASILASVFKGNFQHLKF